MISKSKDWLESVLLIQLLNNLNNVLIKYIFN